MSNLFNNVELASLSGEQVQQLIADVGACDALTAEVSIRGLMARLPWLSRSKALSLVCDAEGAIDKGGNLEKLLAHLFVRAELTLRQVNELSPFMGAYGRKVLQRAVRRFESDPAMRGRNQIAEELLLGIQSQHKGDEVVDGEQVAEEFDRHAASVEPDLQLRQLLADDYGIESPADFEAMLQAMNIVARENESTWLRGSWQQQNQLTRQARALFESAKSQPCSPQALWDWKKLVRSGAMRSNPNTVFKSPTGVEYWGTGERVIRRKDGHPGHAMDTLFGVKMERGQVPLDIEMRQMVQRAYPEQD